MRLFMDLSGYNLNSSQDHARFMRDVLYWNNLPEDMNSMEIYDRAWEIVAKYYGTTEIPAKLIMEEILIVVWDLCEMEDLE